MVCIQCYLPPILFMLYMKFLQPIVAPYIQPAIDKFITYFWGPQAVQSACPIRPRAKKTEASGDNSASASTSSEPQATTSTATKTKEE